MYLPSIFFFFTPKLPQGINPTASEKQSETSPQIYGCPYLLPSVNNSKNPHVNDMEEIIRKRISQRNALCLLPLVSIFAVNNNSNSL